MTTNWTRPTPEAATGIVHAVLAGLAPMRVDLVPPAPPPAAPAADGPQQSADARGAAT